MRYNGKATAAFDVRRTACYVEQYDTHLPLLTVRETLLFARKCLWAAGAKDAGAEELRRVIQQEAAEQGGGGRAVLVSPAYLFQSVQSLLGWHPRESVRLPHSQPVHADRLTCVLVAVQERHTSRLVSMLGSDDLFVEVALRLLGLEGVGDTVVGDALVR